MTDPQRTRVFEISEYLSKTDHDTICYLYKLPDSHKSCNASRLELLIKLEKLGKFSASRPESLEKVLNAIHRSDLVDIVKKDHCRSVEFASYRELCDQLAQAKLCYTQAKTAEEKLSACLLQKFKSLTPEGLEKRLNEVHRYLQAQVTSSERMADCSREMVARHSVAAAGRSEVAPGSPQGPGKVWQTRVRVLPPSKGIKFNQHVFILLMVLCVCPRAQAFTPPPPPPPGERTSGVLNKLSRHSHFPLWNPKGSNQIAAFSPSIKLP